MRLTRRAVIAGSTAVVGSSAIGRAALSSVQTLDARTAAAAAEALLHHACPGMQVAISRGAKTGYSRAFGVANLETGTLTSRRSVFRIGSLTKQFTAAAIIQLAAQNKLRVDEPVSKYLRTMGALAPVTLLELMNHTAGVHDDADDVSCSLGAAEPKSQIELAEKIAGQRKPFDFAPGTAWLYSNANYVLLGAVIESVTRKPLAEALSSLIFRPLGLAMTAIDTSFDVVKNRASGYTPVEKGPAPFINADYIQISDAGGAGAVRSNAEDLCTWHHALFSGRLFENRYIELMTTPGRLRDGRLSGANRFSPEDSKYGEVQYACGLLVQDHGPNGRVITHNGFINGFSAVLETYPERGVSFAVLCNADVGPLLPFRAVRRAVTEGMQS